MRLEIASIAIDAISRPFANRAIDIEVSFHIFATDITYAIEDTIDYTRCRQLTPPLPLLSPLASY
jgi:hypothetical protein